MKKNLPGPRLQKLIENGDAYLAFPMGNYVFGIASDGETIILGETNNYEEIENSLKQYPNPEDW